MASRLSGRQAGFTLIETIIALAIIAIGGLGALGSFAMASQNLSQSRTAQANGVVAELRSQSNLLFNKTTLINSLTASAYPSSQPSKWADGNAGWALDPWSPFYTVNGAGSVTAVPAATYTAWGATNCASSSIPAHTLCREYYFSQGGDFATACTGGTCTFTSGTTPTWGTVYTLWTRVAQVGNPTVSVTYVEAFAQ